jgi:hypothetical protein
VNWCEKLARWDATQSTAVCGQGGHTFCKCEHELSSVASTVMTMKLRHAGCQRAPDRHMLERPPSVFEVGIFRNRRLLSAPTRRCRIADHPLSPLEDNALLGSTLHLRALLG